MTPANGSLKPSKTAGSGGGGVRTAPRPVVPALPLRFVQHRPTRSEDHHDARTPRSDAVTSPAKAPVAAAAPNTSGERKKDKDKDGEENKEERGERGKKIEGGDARRAQTNGGEPSLRHHRAAAPAEAALEVGSNLDTSTNGHGPDGSQLEASHPVVAAPANMAAEPSAPLHLEASVEMPANLSMPTTLNSSQAHHHHHHPAHHPSDSLLAASPQQPPPISPTREMAAARPEDLLFPPDGPIGDMSGGHFAPARRPIHILNAGPPSMLPVHQSQGFINFGTLHHSSRSSPAPPQSAGMPPPPLPGMPMPDGRAPPMMQPNGGGYPPMMLYAPEQMYPLLPGANGHICRVLGPQSSAPPSYHGPQSSAPPSYHGSQSSAPPGHAMVDDAENLLGYLQEQFSHPEFPDCALELRYSDDRAPPVRITGHSLLFRRSPRLRELLRQQAPQMAPPDGLPLTLLLETDSPWIRSHSFNMAVQRLYGLPLLCPPGPGNIVDGREMPAASGSAGEQIEYALSYAAAGHLLEWAPVMKRGAQIVTHLLGWHNLERVLAFALEGHVDKGSCVVWKYGQGSDYMLRSVVSFIVSNFHSDLSLDVESASPVPYSRFPIHLPPPPSRASGSSVQLGRHGRGSSLQRGMIQFGDLPLNDDAEPAQAAPQQQAQPAQPTPEAVLSRILLNIPFTQLRKILEMLGSGSSQGWAPAEARWGTIKAAVEEREARRRRALEMILAGQVAGADADAIRAGLCGQAPGEHWAWSALGWQEEMIPPSHTRGAMLVRNRVPLVGAQQGPVAQHC